MKAEYRLKKSYRFRYVYKKGKRLTNRLFQVYYAHNGNGRVCVGFSVPKKYGKAYERNLLKRRLRDIYTRLYSQMPQAVMIIVIPRSAAKEADFCDLFDCSKNAVERIKASRTDAK
ncbi:MAG: ribonuclease P protein component [Clostridia bacterium]|nr:ribonuclease P protein component [Clostridia bacterium]